MNSIPTTFGLQPYEAGETDVVRALTAEVQRSSGGVLSLCYRLDADLNRIRVPPIRPPRRTDGLWNHTCFEAFARAGDGAGYHELNFSPSTEWAVYAFDAYRSGMAAVSPSQPLAMHVELSPLALRLQVRIELPELSGATAIALAAVIEDEHGRLAYWALAHPPARPDFHHPDSFVSFP